MFTVTTPQYSLRNEFSVLSIFARIANIPDVDPTRMQRHRRASSTSSSSSISRSPEPYNHLARSRSGSRTGYGSGAAHAKRQTPDQT